MLKGRNWVLKSREMESWKKGSVKFLANFFRQKSILAEIFFWSNFLWWNFSCFFLLFFFKWDLKTKFGKDAGLCTRVVPWCCFVAVGFYRIQEIAHWNWELGTLLQHPANVDSHGKKCTVTLLLLQRVEPATPRLCWKPRLVGERLTCLLPAALRTPLVAVLHAVDFAALLPISGALGHAAVANALRDARSSELRRWSDRLCATAWQRHRRLRRTVWWSGATRKRELVRWQVILVHLLLDELKTSVRDFSFAKKWLSEAKLKARSVASRQKYIKY